MPRASCPHREFHPTLASVFCRTRFDATHYWPGASSHLGQEHRHDFHIEVELPVSHDDRDIEFIQLKELIDMWLDAWYPRNTTRPGSHIRTSPRQLGTTSCEQLARKIAVHCLHTWPVAWCQVKVSEDGENGARVTELRGD